MNVIIKIYLLEHKKNYQRTRKTIQHNRNQDV